MKPDDEEPHLTSKDLRLAAQQARAMAEIAGPKPWLDIAQQLEAEAEELEAKSQDQEAGNI